jgi:molybdate transport system ATP-binding protein
MNDLLRLRRVSYSRPGGPAVLRDLDWTIREGETWAIVGPVGSGKSTLAELVLGRLRPNSGEIEWPFVERIGRPVTWPADVIEFVAFREDSRLFSHARHYYQERFNFSDPLEELMLDEFLRCGISASGNSLRATAAALGVESLRPLSMIKLSNGQMRRARIARALLSRPELLILDDLFLGLDVAGRDEVSRLLGDLVKRGQRLILITRADLVPDWVTNVLHLELTDASSIAHGERGCVSAPRAGQVSADDSGSSTHSVLGALTQCRSPRTVAEPLIELHGVTVAYGERVILNDITWTVRRGERWAVLGPNGSGKSTLLSLLCGDHPQAYSNDVRLFGRRRGSGESIWEIKSRVGLLSPELHLYFHEPLTAAQTAATGFFDVVTLRPTSPEQDERVRALFEQFAICHLAELPFANLSTGEQRLVLLARALVKRPELLILDEPFQSFDPALSARLRDWLDTNLDPAQTLLFVTHHEDEIPRRVTQIMRLDAGRVVGAPDSARAV